mgnify:CR=1 FL=1
MTVTFTGCLVVYLLLMNVIGFGIMGVDKRRAVKRMWRIPERTLFLIALLGGSIGTNLGMQKFRHKTKHMSFVVGMPVILVVQLVVAIYLCASHIL